ncbi:MAG TPA: TonB-dependent receptor, partial [Limnobacter sp.]|nr:TonB-dependent receptor [Limnobacter sp.]
GLQLERSDFSAIGEEAFVPGTNTRQSGAFAIFTASPGNKDSGVFEFGLRTEQVDVDAVSTGLSPATGPVAGGGVTSGPGLNRSFQPQSFSLGYTTPIGQGWSIGGSVSRVERAPSNFELYADGVHVATDAYEKGNPDLQAERGRHAEITSSWMMNRSKFSATAFTSRFSNYIALIGRSGADSVFDEDGDLLTTEDQVPVFDFKAVPARFQGVELAYSTAYSFGKGELKPFMQYDLVRGKRTDGGGNLPRISPQRISAGAVYSQQGWTIAPEIIWVDDSRPETTDQVVEAYQLVNLRLGKNFSWGKSGGEVFASLQNLTDELAFSATTLNTVRQFAPLPGRSALVGLKLAF